MSEILEKLSKVKVFAGEGSPALHKPLLILLALGCVFQALPRMLAFRFWDERMKVLLKDFYPSGSEKLNTHYPFGKLENDGIWEVERSSELKRTSAGHLYRSQLIEENVHGGLPEKIFNSLSCDYELLRLAANNVADKYFSMDEKSRLFDLVGILSDKSLNLDAKCDRVPFDLFIVSKNTLTRGFSINDSRRDYSMINDFIFYLNSLHNLKASGSNALAESQAVNPYFGDLYEPFPLVKEIAGLLQEPLSRVVILSGHAGDGKSTIALDLFKSLKGLDPKAPLASPLGTREPIPLKSGAITIVKDMSELTGTERQQWLEEAFSEDSGSWLIVSNTGPLLNSLQSYAASIGYPEIEDGILRELDRPLRDGDLQTHVLSGFAKPLLILNLSRFDNTAIGARLLGRLVHHPGWADCEDCEVVSACPIFLNRLALEQGGHLIEQRVRWLYRRVTEYEQRLTLRQMVAQLAFSITGGIDCATAKARVEASTASGADRGTATLAEMVFSEGFFGYRAGVACAPTLELRALRLFHQMHIGGPVSPEYDRKVREQPAEDWTEIPAALTHLAERWRTQPKGSPGRASMRRLLLLFGQPRAKQARQADLFMAAMLRSPGLRLLDESRQQGKLALTAIDADRLCKNCLHVLREAFSGFTSTQFARRDDQLYLTLRRPDRDVMQPTQLVVGTLSFRDFVLDYDCELGLPVLTYWRGSRDASVTLPLSLPLLDYILRRKDGELAAALAPIHRAQIDSFQARLLRLADAGSRHSGEIALLRADIRGEVDVYLYLMDKDANGQNQKLVKQR